MSLRLLLLSHGPLAEVLLESAAHILGGGSPRAGALSLPWDGDAASWGRELDRFLEKLRDSPSDPVVILTDLYGGTPTNLAFHRRREGLLEVVTGTNLAMAVKALHLLREGETDPAALARDVLERGRSGMVATLELGGAR